MNKLSNISFILLSFFTAHVFLHAGFKERMKERLPAILAAKDKGSVGEGVDGLLHLRNQEDETAKKLVSEENLDRKEYFSAAAKKNKQFGPGSCSDVFKCDEIQGSERTLA